jgi:hypothetical protein
MNKLSASHAWHVGYPHPADFNFDYSRLLRDTRRSGIARNTRPGLRLLAQRGFTLAELNAWLEGIELPAREPHHTVAVTRVT